MRETVLQWVHVAKAAWWSRGIYGWQDWIDPVERRAMTIDYNLWRYDHKSAGARWQEKASRVESP